MMTYGVLLALSYTYLALFPLPAKIYMVVAVLVFTAVLPSIVVVMLVRSGGAGDLELSRKGERVIPYLSFMAGNIACFFFYSKLGMPPWFLSMFTGVSIALLFALCINFVWKISAHAMGIGGLLGAIMGASYVQMINPYRLFIGVILLAGLTCMSRIILGKHTLMQLLCGFLLGFASTFITLVLNISY
jgi:membrane-associated phospholipid phosphatase